MKISNTHSDVYDRESDYYRDLEDAIPKEKDYPVEDMFGTEIVEGDFYYIFGDNVVVDQNLDDYITEYLHGQIFKAK